MNRQNRSHRVYDRFEVYTRTLDHHVMVQEKQEPELGEGYRRNR